MNTIEIKKLYITLFLLNLSNELINMGLIVWAGTQSVDPIQQTAWVTFWAATGYIFAIFINIGDRFRVSRRLLLISTLASSGLVFLFPKMTILWGLAILIRSAVGQVTYARFATAVPELAATEAVPTIAKGAQLAGTFGNAGSMLLSPFVSTHFDVEGVFLVNIGLVLSATLATTGSSWLKDKKAFSTNSMPAFQHISGWLNASAGLLFITWALYGTFFVIEIPLLQSRLQANASMISVILFLNLLANIVTTKYAPEKKIADQSLRYFIFSCVGLSVFTWVYLNSSSFLSILISILILGIFNSIINFSVYLSVQQIQLEVKRESFFLGYRLAAELGILSGIVFVYFIRQPEAAIFYKLSLLACVIVVIQFLFAGVSFYMKKKVPHGT